MLFNDILLTNQKHLMHYPKKRNEWQSMWWYKVSLFNMMLLVHLFVLLRICRDFLFFWFLTLFCTFCQFGAHDMYNFPLIDSLMLHAHPPDYLVLFRRPYWRCYFPNTQAIIYVVDSSDTDRLVIAKDEFHAILEVHLFWINAYRTIGLIWQSWWIKF